jgi:hypothetical protein
MAERVIADLRPSLDRVHHDVDSNGVLWARGRAYKASFGDHGATYIPFFGSDAPRNFPVTFSLGSATQGGSHIEFAQHADARRDSDRITLDRGAIREVYDITVDGVEQSFDLDQHAADGELELRIGYESELEAVVRGDGLASQNELGRVDYSRAVAIDARGERIALAARRSPGRRRIARLPGVVPQRGELLHGGDVQSDERCVRDVRALSRTLERNARPAERTAGLARCCFQRDVRFTTNAGRRFFHSSVQCVTSTLCSLRHCPIKCARG